MSVSVTVVKPILVLLIVYLICGNEQKNMYKEVFLVATGHWEAVVWRSLKQSISLFLYAQAIAFQ